MIDKREQEAKEDRVEEIKRKQKQSEDFFEHVNGLIKNEYRLLEDFNNAVKGEKINSKIDELDYELRNITKKNMNGYEESLESLNKYKKTR